METSFRTTKWNVLDKILAKWRARFILPYLSKDAIVADIGCGQEGDILMDISSNIKEGFGYDYNLKEEKRKKNIFLSKENFLEVDKKFDVIIIMLAVLEHLHYPSGGEEMLGGVFDKLNPEGVFIMTTPDKSGKWLLELLAYDLKVINKEEIDDHKHYFDKAELLELAKNVGFSEITHKHFQFGMNNLLICKK